MASILCRNKGHVHTHTSVTASKICYGIIKPTVEFATSRQVAYVAHLGGDALHAAKLSKGDCSTYIKSLQSAPSVSAEPSAPPVKPKPKVPLELFNAVPEGYYAWQLDTDTPLTFLRVSRPTRGKYRGTTKVQTQHGPNFLIAWVSWPSGQVIEYRYGTEAALLGIIVDYRHAARVYAMKKGKCCRCNTELTDVRSRHYGIGPECVKHWPWYTEMVDNELGHTFEQKHEG